MIENYRGHWIHVQRDIYSGLHEVTSWAEGTDRDEDGVHKGGYVSSEYAIALARKDIDEYHELIAQLEGNNE